MSSLGNDGALVGFWPLDEPSGCPLFKNYAPSTAKYPSGISFDMQVVACNADTDEEHGSLWPGTDIIFNSVSGVNVRGYRVQGHWQRESESPNPRGRYLLLGNGDRDSKKHLLPPTVAQSGFTAGIWIYPTTDGYLAFHSDPGVALATAGWEQEAAYSHALYGMFGFDQNEAGWIIGVSGALSSAAQFDIGPHPLRAFLVQVNDGTALEIGLGSPIESDRYTHVTMTYRYVDGVNNEMVLYKDGRVAGSGSSNFDLTQGGSSFFTSRALTIGGTNEVQSNDEYTRTTGWGHLVSGAYYFNRVLHEGEILDLHLCGGLQPDISAVNDTKEVSLLDSKLLCFIPWNSLGYADASKNFRALMDDFDPGDETDNFAVPGPFGGGARFQNSTAGVNFVVANSGLCNAIVDSLSWSIGVWGTMKNSSARDDNMVLSWGSVSTTTNSLSWPVAALTTGSFGIAITEQNVGSISKAQLEVRPLGDRDADTLTILASGLDPFTRVASHYGVVYDDQTRGVAFYINGVLQGSGNLVHSMTDQLSRLVGSGFPLMFGNGVQNSISANASKGVHADGGEDNWLGQITVLGRPIEPCEMRAIALSGIDIKVAALSQYDTRLMGYWPCDDYQDGDIVVEDKARMWNDVPGHLARGDSFTKWERAYNRTGIQADEDVYTAAGTAFIDLYGTRTVPEELAGFGNLGITSGVWSPRGGGMGTAIKTNSASLRSSISNLSCRYKPNIEERDLRPQNILGEYIIGFEVTPSGDIPAITLGQSSNANKFEFNSCIFNYGNLGAGSTNGEQRAFLTSINAPNGSGISIVFQNRTGTFSAANTRMIASGNLIYGVPNNVLLHGKYDDPYTRNNEIAVGTAPYRLTLYINGQQVQQIVDTTNSLFMWDVGVPDSAADHYLLNFGGEAGDSAITAQMSRDSGLGDNYLREMFVMRGIFRSDEVEELAVSGIRNTALAGYIAAKPKTQVAINDADLRGYWRFNGFAGGAAHGVQGSGTTDLSVAGNHLLPLAEIQAQRGTITQSAYFLRAMPGPLVNSNLGVQCSGFTYQSTQVGNTAANRIAPFMASGVSIDDPAAGFSIGFLLAKREDVSTSRFDGIIAYGTAVQATVADTTTDSNRGWIIGMDDTENMKMVMSQGGQMYLDNVAAAQQSGQIVCGSFDGNRAIDDDRVFQTYLRGDMRPPRLDYWSHYLWTYDATDKTLRHYLNGELADIQALKTEPEFWDGPQNPQNPAARYLTFFQHTENDPWNFNGVNTNDYDSVLTDICYFSRPLTEGEARYVAFNGIDEVVGTEVSGVVGGWVYGQGEGSGIVGGYERNLDTVSGIIGAYFPASVAMSGIIGGFMSGITFSDDTIGGYMHGGQLPSGIFGGIIFGTLQGSGAIGGFMLGGLQGTVEFDASYTVSVMSAQDFDTQLHVLRIGESDFDARVVLFQDEIGPIVDIPTPDVTVSGLAPPFNQYFVGKASGQQGKTIAKTRWTFGDLTPSVEAAESGAGCYPVLHNYAASGFYIAKFEAIDSDGQHGSATRIVNAASGIDPVIVSLSGVPRSGSAALIIDFSTVVDILPPGVSISTKLLNFDDGQSTVSFNPTHAYSEPGIYKPIWCVRDSRGIIWCDSLEAGNDFLRFGG